ncbi:hypothetical protein Pint_35794 [Pistacia integerrima]|uniref:Uncharacterized protein n=1 Tax=Pistacia integerrima TaxID=434235 RepID=A0ACC0Y2Y6_9ROSI|nr:hypothetical protein Pint_35794 [Pistacia integerrima]
MEKNLLPFIFLLSSPSLLHGNLALTSGTNDGSENNGDMLKFDQKLTCFGGFIKVHTELKIHPSHGQYYYGSKDHSGVGFGNFIEMGPLDGHLKPKNFTWLKKADLLFVDSPVGVGFSYVEDKKLLVKTDEEAASDLTILLKELFNENETLQRSPLFIFGESYGGRFAVTLGVSALRVIEAGELKIQLGAVALGDSWISPEDFVFTWAPFLKDVSRMDNNGLIKSNRLALRIKHQLAEGKYENATTSWIALENVIFRPSTYVDVYNFLHDLGNDLIIDGMTSKEFKGLGLDVICSTKGAEAWVQKLKLDGLEEFFSLKRFPLYCGNDESITKGFVTSYKNLFFHWILGSGHFVPAEQPCVSLQMVGNITRSPNY